MDELRILIARLGWPSISARWCAMQELAARLGEPDSRVETALLQLLSSCKLEAEVVEILCIFWMATQAHGYSPALNLPENIPRTSILSEMILKSIGFLPERDAGGLEEVPDGFEIPQDFNGVQGCPSFGKWPLSGARTEIPTQMLRFRVTPGISCGLWGMALSDNFPLGQLCELFRLTYARS